MTLPLPLAQQPSALVRQSEQGSDEQVGTESQRCRAPAPASGAVGLVRRQHLGKGVVAWQPELAMRESGMSRVDCADDVKTPVNGPMGMAFGVITHAAPEALASQLAQYRVGSHCETGRWCLGRVDIK